MNTTEQKHTLPPFTMETALQKVQLAEDAWNSRAPERIALAYTGAADSGGGGRGADPPRGGAPAGGGGGGGADSSGGSRWRPTSPSSTARTSDR